MKNFDISGKVNVISEAVSRLVSERGNANSPIIIAIDGRCASGKTTLAEELKTVLGCTVFHMDSFFLRSEQRTEERLSKAGENVDHERFLGEVLKPLRAGEKNVVYRAFDCGSMSLTELVCVRVGDICVIEGSYSCHSELWDYYDLRIFLDVEKEEQLRRIVLRNGEQGAEAFRNKWIPLEERYFAEFDIRERCDIRL